MKRTSTLTCAILSLTFGVGCRHRQNPTSDPGPADPPRSNGAVHAPNSTHREDVRFTAVISARHIANVSAQVEGTLKTVAVRLGESVAVGDVLATIDNRMPRQAAAAARAIADMRKAAARAALARARHSAAELDRGLKLQGSGLVSEQALETLRSAHADAQAEIVQAQAASREALALLAQAQRSLEWTVVRAPVAGTIALRFVDPGNQVHRDEALVRIVADDAPWIRFGMPARERDLVGVGDAITFVSVDGTLRTPAEVVHIAPDVDPLSELVLAEGSFTQHLLPSLYPGFAGYVVASSKPSGSR
jgi:RND family efflux transporter MFP subunit